MTAMQPDLLVVGRDTDGSWTVREGKGMMLGRFPSADAAQRFAEGKRRGRPETAIATSAGVQARIEGRLSLGARRIEAARGHDA